MLPLRGHAFGRGTDRNSLAEKAQSNPVRHSILRRGVHKFKPLRKFDCGSLAFSPVGDLFGSSFSYENPRSEKKNPSKN